MLVVVGRDEKSRTIEHLGEVELPVPGRHFYVSSPKRAADEADGSTSPEELIAAAHTSCAAMQSSALLAQGGGTPQSLGREVQADVTLGPARPRWFRLTGIKLTVRVDVKGLGAPQFETAAQDAKATCPISKALAGVTLDAVLGN